MNNETNDKTIYGFGPEMDEMTEEYSEELMEEFSDDFEEEDMETSSSEKTPFVRKRKKKVRVKKKRRKKYYTLKFLGLIILCVGLYFFAHSTAFTVENIELEKNNIYSLERIQELTGLKTGVNLFEADLKASEKKLEARSYIRDAEIKRKLPDTIKISLDLRQPVAVVAENQKYIMLDKEGIVLEIRDKLPHYTLLYDLAVEEAEIGQPVKIKEEKKYEEYMSLLKKMEAADLYFRKIVIGEDGIQLYIKKDLYAVGKKKNIVAGMEDGNLKAVLYTLSKKDVSKGVLEVGDDQYYSFSKSSK